MSNPKFKEGFIILNESKIPKELLSEIKYYNGLVKNLESAKNPDNVMLAVQTSEIKIKELLSKHKGLYPVDLCYGPIALIASLYNGNTNEFIKLLAQVKQDFGDNYLKKLVLFNNSFNDDFTNTPTLGWSFSLHTDLASMQNNLFMLAVKTGKTEVVKAILDLINDKKLKKAILLQCMQYWKMDNELFFKTILSLAMESQSPKLVDYLMSTMDELGILAESARMHQNLMSSSQASSNLLRTAIETSNPEMVQVVINYQHQLEGYLWNLFTANPKLFPDYIAVQNLTFFPVFMLAMTTNNEPIFSLVWQESMKFYTSYPQHDDYMRNNARLGLLVPCLGCINLEKYIQHKDFNPEIFRTILQCKIQTDNEIHSLGMQRKMFSITVFPLSGPDGKDKFQYRKQLWNQDLSLELTPANEQQIKCAPMLVSHFHKAVSAKNYKAAGIILAELFNQNYRADMDFALNQHRTLISPTTKIINELLLQAIDKQNPALIVYACKNKIKLNHAVFEHLTKIKDANDYVLMVTVLFHTINDTGCEYQERDLKLILDVMLVLIKLHPELEDPISQCIAEIETPWELGQKTNKSHDHQHLIDIGLFNKSKIPPQIKKMIEDIKHTNKEIGPISPNQK